MSYSINYFENTKDCIAPEKHRARHISVTNKGLIHDKEKRNDDAESQDEVGSEQLCHSTRAQFDATSKQDLHRAGNFGKTDPNHSMTGIQPADDADINPEVDLVASTFTPTVMVPAQNLVFHTKFPQPCAPILEEDHFAFEDPPLSVSTQTFETVSTAVQDSPAIESHSCTQSTHSTISQTGFSSQLPQIQTATPAIVPPRLDQFPHRSI